jgi:DNA anti-recombination protein RmuC
MAIPALKFELEEPVEERIARLEAHVEHIQADVSDTKVDIRRLNDKVDGLDQKLCAKIEDVKQMLTTRIDDVNQTLTAKIEALDQKLTAKIEALDQKLTAKIDALNQAFSELRISRALDRVWWLLMCGTLLGVMARGFKWI